MTIMNYDNDAHYRSSLLTNSINNEHTTTAVKQLRWMVHRQTSSMEW